MPPSARRDHATFGDQGRVIAEQQLLHRVVVGGDPFDRQVAARRMGSDACLLGLGHGAQQRNATFFVVVDTDTEVDLVRPRVGVEGFIEAEDRIARRHFDSREQTHGEGLEEG